MATASPRQRFAASCDGTAAIEFAMIAPIFFLLVFMLFEYSYYEFKKSVLRSVVLESARSIQTGEIQNANDPAAAFKTAYCSKTPSFLDCDDIAFDVRSFSLITDVVFPPVVLDANDDPTNFEFAPGAAEQIVTVRATVKHEFVYGPLREIFQPDEKPVIILGYNVFRNEPFQ